MPNPTNGSLVDAKPDKANGEIRTNGVEKVNGLMTLHGNSLQVPTASNGLVTAVEIGLTQPVQIKKPPFAFRILVSFFVDGVLK
jgi:hypothetical protein